MIYRDAQKRWVIDPTHLREYTRDDQLVPKFASCGLETVCSVKTLHRFPVTDYFLKRLGYPRDVYQTHRIWKALRRVRVPIIGYYNWEFVLRKPGS
ncbi:MAG: hypothetical protein EHM61_16835 [Acidobacteria bacterium]|nr:MAG: hypothetical protein EHM61_16835 [Acidobacteriota bacterium]